MEYFERSLILRVSADDCTSIEINQLMVSMSLTHNMVVPWGDDQAKLHFIQY